MGVSWKLVNRNRYAVLDETGREVVTADDPQNAVRRALQVAAEQSVQVRVTDGRTDRRVPTQYDDEGV